MSKGMAATAEERLVDYSTVTNKKLLIDRIMQLQTSIRENKEQLDRENALKREFQSTVNTLEKALPAAESQANQSETKN